MKDKNIHYNILIEAEAVAAAVAAAYSRRKPDNIDIPDIQWEAASDETRSLLIHIQHLAKHLGEAYMEAEKQGNKEKASLLYHILATRPYLSSINPRINDLHECREKEAEFTESTRLWIKETKSTLYRDFL